MSKIFQKLSNLVLELLSIYLLRVSEPDEVPISSHTWIASSTSKQLQNFYKKLKYIFMTTLGLAESFKR